jgi:hypothetical protein
MVHSATLHADHPGHSTLGVGNVRDLKYALRRLLEGPKLDAMDFHTHGAPGAVELGTDHLTVNTLEEFRNEGFDALFKAGGVVEFHGCNVAERAIGELFLAEFGSIFLRGAGGEVRGSTSYGFQDPLYSGETAHLWGEWVTAEVRVGGGVRMRNQLHLHPHLIRRGIERLRQLVAQQSTPRAGRARQPGPVGLGAIAMMGVSADLDLAERYLDSNGGQPSYRSVYFARDSLSRARRSLGEANAFVLR